MLLLFSSNFAFLLSFWKRQTWVHVQFALNKNCVLEVYGIYIDITFEKLSFQISLSITLECKVDVFISLIKKSSVFQIDTLHKWRLNLNNTFTSLPSYSFFFNWLKQLQPLQHYYMQQNLQYATYRKGKDLN